MDIEIATKTQMHEEITKKKNILVKLCGLVSLWQDRGSQNKDMENKVFKSTHKVRPFECDFYGHVNNAIYLNYLEFARMETLEAKGLSLAKIKDAGFILVIRQINILYKFPATVNDIITIRTSMKSYRNTTCTFYQQIVRNSDEKILVEADVSWAVINSEGRPVRIPKMLRDALGFERLKKKRDA